MFAGSIQDRLRAPRGPGGFPVNSAKYRAEQPRDYSHSCHHIPELKEKDRRIGALEKKLLVSEEARLQLNSDIDALKDKLEAAAAIKKRNETIIQSQQQAILQLQQALRAQQKAVESILGEDGNFRSIQKEIEASDASLRRAVARPSPGGPGPGVGAPRVGGGGPAAVARERPAESFGYGFGLFGGEEEEEEESEPEAPRAPGAKLHTPGTTPRTNASSPRSPSPAGFI
ncbi:unnamed protein product [Effrenium voratum]|nr:unnamed protein product [Effrenium voratum]